MSGNDFRNEYKAAMDELTPNSEILELVSRRMNEAAFEPIRMPLRKKSFFSRYRAILTAAAALVTVIGICAAGAVVVSHFNNMNSLSGGSSFDKAAAGAASVEDEEADYPADYPEENEKINDTDGAANLYQYPEAPAASLNINTSEIKNEAAEAGNSGFSDTCGGTGIQNDSWLKELAEKAQNGTLTVEDMGKDVTVQGDDAYLQVFCGFTRDAVSYTLIADFEDTDGKLIATRLYIDEADRDETVRQIDLVNNSNYLEEYFAGNYSEKID